MNEEALTISNTEKKSSKDNLPEGGELYKAIKDILWYIHTDASGNLLPDPRSFEKILTTILGNFDFYRVVWYFIEHGAATSSTLISKLGLPHRSIHNYITSLNQWGIIFPDTKARSRGSIHGDRGRIPDIWQTPDATTDQVNEAIQIHRRTKSPKYRVAEAFAQSYLHDYLEPRRRNETTYKDLLAEAKARGLPEPIDIADLACQYFNKETTIKAWR